MRPSMNPASRLACLALSSAILATAAQAQDVASSRDHPMIRRVAGSTIREFNVTPNGQCILPLGPARGDTFTESSPARGKVTRIVYTQRQGLTVGDVYREFDRSFRDGGIKASFTCSDGSCGTGTGPANACSAPWNGVNGQRQFTGSTVSGNQVALISLHVQAPVNQQRAVATLTVIEPTPPDQGGVGAGISPMRTALVSRGFMDLEGPLFANGSSRLLPQADRVLQQVAAYLKQNPSVRLFVVNHTDNEGNWQREMELSRDRAQVIVRALGTKYGITGNRLFPQGVGPLAPVADVRTDAGRERNTRTTLVVME